MKTGSAGWEARMMPLCYVVPCLSNIVIIIIIINSFFRTADAYFCRGKRGTVTSLHLSLANVQSALQFVQQIYLRNERVGVHMSLQSLCCRNKMALS